MSVRVNLLPSATRERDRVARQRLLVALAFALLLLLLLAVWWWQGTRITAAEDDLSAAQADTALLRSEVQDLAPFGDLRDEVNRVDGAVAESLVWEVTVAGMLQDLAAAMVADAQLDNLNVNLDRDPEPHPVTGERAVGSFTMGVQALSTHAPGVERFLIALDQHLAFFDVHVSSSVLDTEREDDLEVVSFTVDGLVSEALLTGRYAEGVPGVER